MAWTVDGLAYTTRKKLTIDQTKVDANLTDFPTLVKLSASNFDFAKSNTDGFDIRFTDSDGSTLLKYERLRHDSANSLADYWVKVPAVSGTVDTDFYIYYRTTDTVDGADPTNVYDTSFKGVWHLNDLTTSTNKDSTATNNGAKKAANEPAEANGKIYKAQHFDGTDDYIDIGAGGLTTEARTLSMWVNSDDQTTGDRLISNRTGTTFSIQYESGAIQTWSAWGTVIAVAGSNGTWYHYTFVFSGGGNATGYKNGGIETTNGADTSAWASSMSLGAILDGAYGTYFDGFIEEVCISTSVRSAAWIKATYNTGNNSLLTYGGEETSGTNSQVQISNVWKPITIMQYQVSSAWKAVTKAQVRISGVWKSVF